MKDPNPCQHCGYAIDVAENPKELLDPICRNCSYPRECGSGADSLDRVGRVLTEKWARRIGQLAAFNSTQYEQDKACGMQECLDDLRAEIAKHSTDGSELRREAN